MCGAVVTNSVEQTRTPPEEWIAALFERITWPEQWAMYFATGTRRIEQSDGALNVEFHWHDGMRLNGLFLWFMTMATLFGLEPPDRADGLLRPPIMLGAEVRRDHGG